MLKLTKCETQEIYMKSILNLLFELNFNFVNVRIIIIIANKTSSQDWFKVDFVFQGQHIV